MSKKISTSEAMARVTAMCGDKKAAKQFLEKGTKLPPHLARQAESVRNHTLGLTGGMK